MILSIEHNCLRGISGGIEFNWPQHHRPSTFEPIDYTIEAHADGSKTVWVSEVERMFRTKGMAGFRLYPDKAYLEINAKLFNRTPFPQTFLWWANPAVKVNDEYQTVFPPDVHAVFDHGKRDVSEFPIAKGTYYKVDYSKGVDISLYKNIPVPTSYMAIKSKYDFMGGYENDSKGGLLHVANHHISPGKKQWTWGNGEFGYAWDRNLTDEDGPYIELMTGVFTDNQPDFSWIQPNEERHFTQYFMPYSELGVVKNATKNALVNLEFENGIITIKFYTTSIYQQVKGLLKHDGETVWEEHFDISPGKPFERQVHADAGIKKENLTISLFSKEGKTLVSYSVEPDLNKEIPEAAKPAKVPSEINSIEELFLTGLHIEQYRHATFKATDYYEEALKREPGDIRNNNALGRWYLRCGKFSVAEKYFRVATTTLMSRNPNPYDGEPLYNLGLALFLQGRYNDAKEWFYKATWNAAFQDTANFYLARIETLKGEYDEAIELINQSLRKNSLSQSARHLKTILLRKSRKEAEALAFADDSIALDLFSFGCRYEKYLLLKNQRPREATVELNRMQELMRGNIHTYIEYSLDYAHAGLYAEAFDFLSLASQTKEGNFPMIHYYLGYFAWMLNDSKLVSTQFTIGKNASPDYCFPNRIEDANVLQFVMTNNAADPKAPYYLGNYWYANRQYEDAIQCWEKSLALDDSFPTVHRNLALAMHNKLRNFDRAKQLLERAFELDPTDARVLMELDQLHKKLNKPHQERLQLLEKYLNLTEERDDLYLERVTLYNALKNHETAIHLINNRKFHPWEGGEGKVVAQHLIANIEMAKAKLSENQYEEALHYLIKAETYPENLGEGKLYGAQENDINFLKGLAYEGMGNINTAKEYFTKATHGLSIPVQAIYYNDQQPDKIFYQGLAWKKLGECAKADTIFNRLIDFGKNHYNDEIKIDYFAVSLPDLLVFDLDLNQRNKNHCNYLIGLGNLGLNNGKIDTAIEYFNAVLRNDINHLGAFIHKEMAKINLVIQN